MNKQIIIFFIFAFFFSEIIFADNKDNKQQVAENKNIKSGESFEIKPLLSEEIRRKLEIKVKPRRKFISASTKEYKYAAYMEAWRANVVNVGNNNYPEEAKNLGLSGDVILDVALNQDGTVNDITIRRSSGEKILDDAAVTTVKLASPFAPFPDSFKDEIDILHITRTWQFLNMASLSGRELIDATVYKFNRDINKCVEYKNTNCQQTKYISKYTNELMYYKYFEDCDSKIKKFFNKPYIQEAFKDKPIGTVLVDMSIVSDGYINGVNIVKSSGFKSLDEITLKIIKAAPLSCQFTEDIKAEIDILHIVLPFEYKGHNKPLKHGTAQSATP